MFGIEHPVVLAPMGGVAGGALTAAVSDGGGLVDPGPFAESVRAAGIPLMVQVTTVAEARRALDVDADVIVAQGSEAGGHGGERATLPFVPAVVDIAGATPVLAAGGIADGRGLAAALMLGAAGAMMGTRFEATVEALLEPEESKAITAAGAADTVRGRVLDIATNAGWPAHYTARTLRNGFTDRWQGRESALESDEGALTEYRTAAERGDRDYLPIWAGEAVDLINELDSARGAVAQIAEQAERTITAALT
ncbi:MAG: hypothetical protein NVS4B6_06940 [Mycobacterium sp.]